MRLYENGRESHLAIQPTKLLSQRTSTPNSYLNGPLMSQRDKKGVFYSLFLTAICCVPNL